MGVRTLARIHRPSKNNNNDERFDTAHWINLDRMILVISVFNNKKWSEGNPYGSVKERSQLLSRMQLSVTLLVKSTTASKAGLEIIASRWFVWLKSKRAASCRAEHEGKGLWSWIKRVFMTSGPIMVRQRHQRENAIARYRELMGKQTQKKRHAARSALITQSACVTTQYTAARCSRVRKSEIEFFFLNLRFAHAQLTSDTAMILKASLRWGLFVCGFYVRDSLPSRHSR